MTDIANGYVFSTARCYQILHFGVSFRYHNHTITLKHPQVGRAVEECCYGGAAKLDLVVASEMLMKIF
jgi:hypothetical protein